MATSALGSDFLRAPLYRAPGVADAVVNERELWLVFDMNPDGGEFDVQTGQYVWWRKNRQPNSDPAFVGTDLNRNWDYKWGCCAGSSGAAGSEVFRGPKAFSAPETDAVRRFVDSRVVGGVQQISAAINFHSFSELVLWPYGYTCEPVSRDMTWDDYEALAAMGQAMAAMNGYAPGQSSELYVTDGSIDDRAQPGTDSVPARAGRLPLPRERQDRGVLHRAARPATPLSGRIRAGGAELAARTGRAASWN